MRTRNGKRKTAAADRGEALAAYSIGHAREAIGDLVARAGYGNERIAVTRYGRPTAFLIGPKDMERLAALDKSLAA